MKINITNVIRVVLVLLIYLVLSKALLLNDPPVFPDETSFATVSYSLVAGKKYSSDWFEAQFGQASVSEMVFHGPLYYYLLAGVFQLFGFGVNQLRFASMFLGLISMSLIYLLLVKNQKRDDYLLGMFSMLVIASDNFFLRSSRFGRPEMMVIMFSLLGLVSYTAWLKKKSKWTFWLVGLAIIGALLSHYFLGLIILGTILIDRLVVKKGKILKDSLSWGVVASILGGALVWGLKVISIRNEVEKVVSIGTARLLPTFRSVQAILTGDIRIRLLALTYLVSFIVLSFLKGKNRFEKVMVIFGWISLGIVLWGGSDWYLSFFGLVGVLSLYGIGQVLRRRGSANGKYFMLMVMVIIIVVNVIEQRLIKLMYLNYSYEKYGESISKMLPKGAKVWVRQLIPDPSLYLGGNRQDLHLVFEEFDNDFGVTSRLQQEKAEYMVVLEEMEVLRPVIEVQPVSQTKFTPSLKVVRLK